MWIIVSIPLWAIGFFLLLIGLAGLSRITKTKSVTPGEALAFSLTALALSSGALYLAAKVAS